MNKESSSSLETDSELKESEDTSERQQNEVEEIAHQRAVERYKQEMEERDSVKNKKLKETVRFGFKTEEVKKLAEDYNNSYRFTNFLQLSEHNNMLHFNSTFSRSIHYLHHG